MTYDLNANRIQNRIEKAHNNDINSICYANSYNSNIILSAGDDCLVKVWDKRSLINNKSVVGKFVGHTEGITYVTSREDGVYLATNGKDQLLKVWDMRKMIPAKNFKKVRPIKRLWSFNYMEDEFYYEDPREVPRHPDDASVFTFCGHEVL